VTIVTDALGLAPGCCPEIGPLIGPIIYVPQPECSTVSFVSNCCGKWDDHCWKKKVGAGCVYTNVGANAPGADEIVDVVGQRTTCVKTLNIAGHGSGAGVGFYDPPIGKSGGKYNCLNENTSPAVLGRIAAALCECATVNIYGCKAGYNRAALAQMATLLRAKVCACTGETKFLWFPFTARYTGIPPWLCFGPKCYGEWICEPSPNACCQK